MKRIYVVELENKFDEYIPCYKIAVIAESKEEAETIVSEEYKDYIIEATNRIECNRIIV